MAWMRHDPMEYCTHQAMHHELLRRVDIGLVERLDKISGRDVLHGLEAGSRIMNYESPPEALNEILLRKP